MDFVGIFLQPALHVCMLTFAVDTPDWWLNFDQEGFGSKQSSLSIGIIQTSLQQSLGSSFHGAEELGLMSLLANMAQRRWRLQRYLYGGERADLSSPPDRTAERR